MYDEETGLYYLRSRYYNPEWGRFINADAVFDNNAGPLGINLFTYCANRVVGGSDEDGTSFWDDFANGLYKYWVKPYETRYKTMVNDPSVYNIANYLTIGYAGNVKGALAPEKPLSLQHWMDSATTIFTPFSIFYRPPVPLNALIVPSWAPGPGIIKSPNPNKIDNLAIEIMDWLGNGSRIITNKNGDKVFLSNDELRKIRFDILKYFPHDYPHSHVEVFLNGAWWKSGPIFPKK